MPKVSVVIPTCNRAPLVGEAVASVLGQTFGDFELIVVDDGSTDGTADVLARFDDSRLRYDRLGTKQGVSAARNHAIGISSGELVAFLDDDDQWLPHKLESQVRLIDRSPETVACVYAGHYACDRASRRIVREVVPRHRGHVFEAMCVRNFIGTASTVLVRRSALERVGLFELGLDFGEDHDLWLRMAAVYHFDCVEEPLVYYNLHGGNITHRYDVVIRDLERRLVRYAHVYARNRAAARYSYRELGQLYCQTGRMRRGRQAFWRALRSDPLSLGCYYDLGLSLLGPAGYRRFKETKERALTAVRDTRRGLAGRARSSGSVTALPREP